MKLDPRLNAYRSDLADARLRDKVKARNYSDGQLTTIVEPRVALRAQPEFASGFITEALLGDLVRVFETRQGWAWGQMEKDNYVGYLPLTALSDNNIAATHRVKVPATFIYPKADLKSQPATRIFMNSLLVIEGVTQEWAGLAGGGYIYRTHICLKDDFETDPVTVAEGFINVPYLWGGSTQDGLDCSALVQQAYHACGRDCPRDTDMIEEEIGETGHNSLQRGDLIFWDGHIGMMVDEKKMIHANGHHMAVAVEDFAAAKDRISKIYGSEARFKRAK